MIEVSVIIPTYNRLWCLPQAIRSCQTEACSVEIIVVDDGSTDGTWDWLSNQSEVIAIRQNNWGKDTAVNNGFAHARGTFVRFLDSDDWLLPQANERQLDLAKRKQADVVVSGHMTFDETTKRQTTHLWEESDDFISQQLGETGSGHYSAYLFRRSFVANIPHR